LTAQPASAQPAPRPREANTLVRVEQVVKHFPAGLGQSVKAVDGVSFEIREGETLGLVGESGCGKSTLARLVTQLIPVTSGRIFLGDVELTRLRGEKLRQQRRQLQMIFQDPFASLDPRMTVGDIIAEPLDNFGVMRGRKRSERGQELLRIVGLNPEHASRYPHEFSGGQRQRIGIARSLALHPRLLILDEPVSALDVSIQAGVINLLDDLRHELGLSYVFIAHDLSVVKHISDRIAVMYLGKIVEIAPTSTLFEAPQHPYTKALLASIPVPDPARALRPRPLAGELPSPIDPPPGCHFHPRCPEALPLCKEVTPALQTYGPGCAVACHVAAQRLGLAAAEIRTLAGAAVPAGQNRSENECCDCTSGGSSQHCFQRNGHHRS